MESRPCPDGESANHNAPYMKRHTSFFGVFSLFLTPPNETLPGFLGKTGGSETALLP